MKSMPMEQPAIDLGRYWSILVARWFVVLAGIVIGVLIAVAYLVMVPRTYASSTTVSVFPISSDPYASNRNSANLLDMAAEAVTASSFRVADLAADSLDGVWKPAMLRQQTSVSAGSDTTTMTITVRADSESRARAGAAAMAEAYINSRSEQASESIDSVVSRDRERIDDLRRSLTTANARLAAEPPGSAGAAEASADQQIISLQISALLTRISSLEGVDTTGGVVLNPSSMTSVTVEPSRLTILLTGFAGGLGLGVIVAFITHSRRRHVRTPQDLRRELELETLGSWSRPEDAEAAIATVAQRILRVAAVRDARTMSIQFDRSVPLASELLPRLAAEMGIAITSVTSAPSSGRLARAGRSVDGLKVIAVPADTSEAERLRSLRLSDIAIMVVASRAARIDDVRAVVREAHNMGCDVIGAVILPGDSQQNASEAMVKAPSPRSKSRGAKSDDVERPDSDAGQASSTDADESADRVDRSARSSGH